MQKNQLNNKLRIIGGKWRGRKFNIPPLEDIRPTPNRVRETVFNWLAPVISHARCLDLFTGSGALGLEALSRGADTVTFVDQSPIVTRHVREQLTLLNVDNCKIEETNTLVYLSHPPSHPFDITFLDPPFHKNLIVYCCEKLAHKHWLSPNAMIYLETEAELDIAPLLPADWELLRSKKAGQVSYHLARSKPSLPL